MISVICASNRPVLMERMLLASLKRQTFCDWELISVDAASLGFSSAAQALNHGAKLAKGELLVFAHQDVEFLDDHALEQLSELYRKDLFELGGVAGVGFDGRVHSSVLQSENREQAGILLRGVEEALSLDECLFFVSKEKFLEMGGFDDYGATWHFYAVELSLRMRRSRGGVMLLPISVYHLSPGWSLDESYWRTLKKVAKRYRGKEKRIYTTMGVYRNNALLPLEILYRKLKYKLKQVLKRGV